MEFAGKISKMGDKLIIIVPKNYHKIVIKQKLKDVMVKLEKI
jgi:hypothetical protein